MPTGMANESKKQLTNDRVEALILSPAGFWVCAALGAAVVVGIIINVVVGLTR